MTRRAYRSGESPTQVDPGRRVGWCRAGAGPILGAVETEADAADSAERATRSRTATVVAVLVISALVGAATFVLMAVGQAF